MSREMERDRETNTESKQGKRIFGGRKADTARSRGSKMGSCVKKKATKLPAS